MALLLDGNQEAARRKLAEVDYSLQSFTDEVSGRRFAEVSDAAAFTGGRSRGWGRVYVDLSTPIRWSVQVPHPIADENTERVGAEVLRGEPGGVLVLAGAHRNAGKGNAADVAHRTDSVFHSVIDELIKRKMPGVQLHGFANESFPEFDVVVSTGAGDRAVADARLLSKGLRAADLEVCQAWSRKCKLSGTSNEQGLDAAETDARFLHIEMNRGIRTNAESRSEVASAISKLTERWERG
ncbi:hypothetical protein [Streptomyces sp. NPDC093225]|uniref:hypothetical protein n=1 Tax=Streptomyces sp. NPDC093225 TaxID=3366034 RepID=UPI0037F1AA5F